MNALDKCPFSSPASCFSLYLSKEGDPKPQLPFLYYVLEVALAFSFISRVQGDKWDFNQQRRSRDSQLILADNNCFGNRKVAWMIVIFLSPSLMASLQNRIFVSHVSWSRPKVLEWGQNVPGPGFIAWQWTKQSQVFSFRLLGTTTRNGREAKVTTSPWILWGESEWYPGRI